MKEVAGLLTSNNHFQAPNRHAMRHHVRTELNAALAGDESTISGTGKERRRVKSAEQQVPGAYTTYGIPGDQRTPTRLRNDSVVGTLAQVWFQHFHRLLLLQQHRVVDWPRTRGRRDTISFRCCGRGRTSLGKPREATPPTPPPAQAQHFPLLQGPATHTRDAKAHSRELQTSWQL